MDERGAPYDVVVQMRSHPQFLQALRGLVRGYVSAFALPSDKVDEIVLAVDEACCNAIRHSYQGDPDQTLYLRLNARGQALEVELRDEGVPAAPERVQRKELTTPAVESLTPGGLGIPLIYQVFDDVEFIPGDGRGNRLIMRVWKTDAERAVSKDTDA
jgi:anti-sigma regulatory factor (Ser/Thr protein kinase)